MLPVTADDPPQRIASRLHLAILLWVFLWTTLGQGRSLRHILSAAGDLESFQFRVLFCYVLIFTWEWIQLGYIWFGIRKTGMTLRTLIGGRWASFGDTAKDVGLGIGLLFVWIFGIGVFSALTRSAEPQSHAHDIVFALAPRTGLNIAFWVPVSIAAGVCEEVVFRGYLMRQFYAMSKSKRVAIIAQGLLFGTVHSYQGISGIILASFFGLTLGLLAASRRSLRPGMITHALYDALVGIAMYVTYSHYQHQ